MSVHAPQAKALKRVEGALRALPVSSEGWDAEGAGQRVGTELEKRAQAWVLVRACLERAVGPWGDLGPRRLHDASAYRVGSGCAGPARGLAARMARHCRGALLVHAPSVAPDLRFEPRARSAGREPSFGNPLHTGQCRLSVGAGAQTTALYAPFHRHHLIPELTRHDALHTAAVLRAAFLHTGLCGILRQWNSASSTSRCPRWPGAIVEHRAGSRASSLGQRTLFGAITLGPNAAPRATPYALANDAVVRKRPHRQRPLQTHGRPPAPDPRSMPSQPRERPCQSS